MSDEDLSDLLEELLFDNCLKMIYPRSDDEKNFIKWAKKIIHKRGE